MATLFFDYQQLIMQAYEQKKLNNTLPHGLMHLTPAKLKDECLKRCTKDVNRRDERIIRDFCGDLNESKDCYTIIQRCDTDKFKPLVNYLRKNSDNTDEKNIELLAWLIDFSGRPWEIGKIYSGNTVIIETPALNSAGLATADHIAVLDPPEGVTPVEDPIIPTRNDEAEVTGIADVKTAGTQRNPTKQVTAAVLISLVLGTGGMWWWKDKNQPLAHNSSCMYWLEDHYEPVACDQKIRNAMVIALDTMKLKNFRRITRPDTITYNAIGKVWYSKINNKLEYYTSGGEHPVAFDHQLKPITIYIIDKHIHSGFDQ